VLDNVVVETLPSFNAGMRIHFVIIGKLSEVCCVQKFNLHDGYKTQKFDSMAITGEQLYLGRRLIV